MGRVKHVTLDLKYADMILSADQSENTSTALKEGKLILASLGN